MACISSVTTANGILPDYTKQGTNMKPPTPFKNFKGSVDELLDHCSKIDPNVVENEDYILSTEEAIDVIKEEYGCNDEEAKVILDEIKLAEAREIIQKLHDEGIVEVKEYRAGEPLWGLTEKGKEEAKRIKKTHGIP